MSWFPRQNLVYIVLRAIKISQYIAYCGALVPRLHKVGVKRDQRVKRFFCLRIAGRIHLGHPDLHQLLLFFVSGRPGPARPNLPDKPSRDRGAFTLREPVQQRRRGLRKNRHRPQITHQDEKTDDVPHKSPSL